MGQKPGVTVDPHSALDDILHVPTLSVLIVSVTVCVFVLIRRVFF